MKNRTSQKDQPNILRNPPLLILSAILAILPAIMLPSGVDTYALPKVTFLYISTLVLIFFYYIKIIKGDKVVLYRSPLDIPVLLILVYTGVSLFFSGDPILGLVGKYRRYETLPALICSIAIFFVTVQTVREEKSLGITIKAMALGLIPVALYGVMQSAGYDFPGIVRFGSRVHSSLGNPVVFGAYLVIVLPLLFSLARNNHEKIWELFAWLMVPIGFMNLLLSESRGAWLGLIAAVAAALILQRRYKAWSRNKRYLSAGKFKGNHIAAAIIIVAVTIVSLLFLAPLGHFGQRLVSTFAFSEGSTAARIETWKSSLSMMSDKPLLGYGLEQMGYWFPQYQTQKYLKISLNGVADRTHNDFLQVAIDSGIPGLLFYVWMLVIVLLSSLRSRNAPPYSTGLTAAIAGYFAQAQTGIPAVFITPIIWFLLGASMNTVNKERKVTLTLPKWIKSGVFASALALLFIGLTLFALKPVLADINLYNGQKTAKTSLEGAASEFESVLRLYPYQTNYAKLASEFYLDYAGYAQNNIYAQRASLISELALQYNKRDFELAYYVGEANYLSYRLTENQMYLAKAQDYFEQAQRLLPNVPYMKSRLLELALIQGDMKKAVSIAEKLVKAGADDPNAYYVLATEAQKSGDEKKAKLYFQRLKKLKPGFLLKPNES